MNDVQVVVLNGQPREPISITIGTVMVLCFFVALVINYFWQITAFLLLLTALFWFGKRLAVNAARAQGLKVRAVEQDRLYLAGDPRGIYGDFNAERTE